MKLHSIGLRRIDLLVPDMTDGARHTLVRDRAGVSGLDLIKLLAHRRVTINAAVLRLDQEAFLKYRIDPRLRMPCGRPLVIDLLVTGATALRRKILIQMNSRIDRRDAVIEPLAFVSRGREGPQQ